MIVTITVRPKRGLSSSCKAQRTQRQEAAESFRILLSHWRKAYTEVVCRQHTETFRRPSFDRLLLRGVNIIALRDSLHDFWQAYMERKSCYRFTGLRSKYRDCSLKSASFCSRLRIEHSVDKML